MILNGIPKRDEFFLQRFHEIRFKYINLYFQVGVRVVMTDFYITSGVYMFGAVLNAMFVSGELQPWAPLAPAITDEPLQDKE